MGLFKMSKKLESKNFWSRTSYPKKLYSL